jgi:hypothetical protein
MFNENYLRLTLEIDKHIEGYVDAYYGPPELKAAVAAAPKREAAALLDDLAWLQANIPTADPAREKFLTAVLRAIHCSLQIVNGETPDYLDEVAQLYDIQPELVEESRFTAAHDQLNDLLPGNGDLNGRLDQWRKRFELKPEQILPLLELCRAETRERSKRLFPLPDDEYVEVKLTANQPWSAYNWYLGNGRSLIEFNTDIPVSALGLLNVFAHEGYPGHHTEHLLKERRLYGELGYAEQASALLHSPAAVIAEGIATTASEIIFPNGEEYRWTADKLLPLVKLPAESAERLQQISDASRALRYVSGNAAILYHTGQLDESQTIAYFRQHALATEARAAQSFRFISSPLFRSYIFTYTHGYDLIAQAAPEDKTALFQRLLTEQILPSELKNYTEIHGR